MILLHLAGSAEHLRNARKKMILIKNKNAIKWSRATSHQRHSDDFCISGFQEASMRTRRQKASHYCFIFPSVPFCKGSIFKVEGWKMMSIISDCLWQNTHSWEAAAVEEEVSHIFLLEKTSANVFLKMMRFTLNRRWVSWKERWENRHHS